ncbi:putative flippase GtrA [Fictibacillus halophilus]|uniref:Flippase GtrA n=2 Tax=Fictibacillus halophilus TaxID=1610490 RepID=A0ABV2LIR9_9BACL|nr:GtrA family protein [Fictibacillus halophilus]
MNHIISTFENFLKPTNTFIRFLLVGIVNTCIGLSIIFLLMNGIGMSYWLSTFIGNTCGAVVSYILNRNFTFKSNTSLGVSGIRFTAVILISYFGAYGMSNLLWSGILNDTSFRLVTNKEASVLFGACLYTLMNYFGQKYLVFNKTR